MIVEKQHVQGCTVLQIEGVVRLGQSAQFFADALKRALSEDVGHVIIDLSKINYIDSTGIGELVGHLVRFQEHERKLILVGPNERVRKLLRVANVDSLFSIYDDLDAALAAEA